MDALQHILDKYRLDPSAPSPLSIPDTRHGGLTRLWRDLGYRVGAEIGTEGGRFAEEICRGNPGVRLYCIDPYQAYDRYADHVEQAKLDRFYAEAIERLGSYNKIGGYVELCRKLSLDAVKDFAPESLDFVFVDGNHHFDFVVQDIIAWAPIVRKGGIMSGHDYKPEGKERTPIPFGVIQAVNGYIDAHHIKPWFLWRKDKCPSWMWVKI